MADPDNAVDALVDATPDIAFKDLIVRALVQSFFQPQMTGLLHHQDPTSGQVSSIPQFADAPMAGLVRRFHEQYGQQVRDLVINGLDLDDVAGKVADAVTARIVEELAREEPRGNYGFRRAGGVSAEDINKAVRDKVAERLSEREMAAYDARQQEMQAAWERDRARQRDDEQRAIAAGSEGGS